MTSKPGPVAGARVVVFPVDVEPALGGAFFRTTDAYGRFTTFVPAGTRKVDVHVAAPGLTYTAAARLLTGSELPIGLDERSGTLTLSVRGKDVRPILIHHGSIIVATSLIDSWTGRRRIDGDRMSLTIPQMDPGVYTLCAVASSVPAVNVQNIAGLPCVTATLPPFGSVSLSVGE